MTVVLETRPDGDESRYALLGSHFCQGERLFDVDLDHLLPLPIPRLNTHGGKVDDDFGPCHEVAKRLPGRQVSPDDPEALSCFQLPSLPNQRAQGVALGQRGRQEVSPKKAGGACDRQVHGLPYLPQAARTVATTCRFIGSVRPG